jgi:exodeoxyribonuclease VII small subunit
VNRPQSVAPKILVLLFGFTFMVAARRSGTTTPPASYEAALQELEGLVTQLEAGDLALDKLLLSYQRGAELLQFCRERLQAVEGQIKVLDQGALKNWATPS